MQAGSVIARLSERLASSGRPALAPRSHDRGARSTSAAGMSVLVAKDADALAAHVPAWDALTADALEPNVFFESWVLLPALEKLRSETEMFVALVYGPDPTRPQGPARLCGLFPVERRRWHGVPIQVLALWCHRHCFLGLPLLRCDAAEPALEAFLDWLVAAPTASLFEWPWLPGDGAFHGLLTTALRRRQLSVFVSDSHERALWRPGEVLSPSSHRRLQRLRRRLEDLGGVAATAPATEAEVLDWVEDFLQVESRGWKGKSGTAMACTADERAFFLAVTIEAFRRRRLLALTLRCQGRPIALRCSFLAGEGAFAFKTCYDEALAHYSPGALLELETMSDLARLPKLAWMDSCTPADNELLNRLWHQRRPVETLLMATGRWPGRVLVAVLPWLRQARRRLAKFKLLKPLRGNRQ